MYFGTKPFLLVTDLDMIREVTVKHFDKFVDRLVSSSEYLCTSYEFAHSQSVPGVHLVLSVVLYCRALTCLMHLSACLQ